MKKKLLHIVIAFALFSSPNIIFAQAPDLGTVANFVLFTSNGAVGNTGTSQITGDIGSHVGAITGFETPTVVNGSIYNADGVTAQGVADLQAAYVQLSLLPATNTTHTPTFGGGETLLPGVYSIAGAGSIAGNLTLNAQGNPNASFIFKLAGASTSGASSTIILSNGASACNVFWIAEGAISMATLTTMKGTLIAHPGAVSMGAGSSLEGRMFSTSGAVSVYGLSASVPIGCSVTTLWTGNAGTSDWFTPNNWEGGVPHSTMEAFIPDTLLAGRFFPVIDTGIAKVDTLTIQSAASVTVTAILQINGAVINNGILDVSNGTIEIIGSSNKVLSAGTFTNNTIKNLIVSNDVMLSGQDTITGSLSFGNVNNKTFNAGGFLTLKSTANGTANIADITNAGINSGNTIIGNVNVERYIPARRAWRLITSPTDIAGGQSINAAWQEGADPMNLTDPDGIPLRGLGTHITGGLISNGFDQGVNTNPGIKKYENGSWTVLSSTNVLISSQPGYMLFVRGDRTIDLSEGIYAPPTNTVLRSTGALKTNDQIVATAAGFTLIGNPYASRINFHTINKGSAPDTYYLWDPKSTGTNGVGGYITFTWNGTSYDVSPVPTSSFDLNGGIESGSAFFVDNTASNTITVKEKDKNFGSADVFRSMSAPEQLRTNMYTYNADDTKSLLDGTLLLYNNSYSNEVDKSDARKMNNVSENLSIKNGSLLSIEKRQLLTSADTLQFSINSMKVKSYQFEFIAENLDAPGLTAFLEDSYFNTSTPIDLKDTTTFDFNVVNIPASWNPTRFRIVFKQLNVVPVTFITVKAFKQNDDIQVAWKIENEINIKQYEVERSADGHQFEKSALIMAPGNNSVNYTWLDENPFTGNNFYRIKSIRADSEERYSSIVKVNVEKIKQNVVIYPNPITNGIISLQFNNMPAGNYEVKLINDLGQVLLAEQITHASETSAETLKLNKNVARGIYNLNVVRPDKTVLSIKLFY